jgi:superfamily II DNA/RNA helicase
MFKNSANAGIAETDVAVRGVHIDGVSLELQIDARTDHKEYLHSSNRIVRAAEARAVVRFTTT